MADNPDIQTNIGSDRAPVDVARSGYLDREYSIQFEQPLERFSSEFATAYTVSGGQDKYYALVFHNAYALRPGLIERLMRLQLPFLPHIVAVGKVITPQKREQYAIVLDRPGGQSLYDIVRGSKGLPEATVVTRFIEPMAPILQALFEQHIVHGSLNPHTVFIDMQTGQIMLGECISSYCGYMQDPAFECLNQLVADPFGKSTDDFSVDYFSLGMMVTYMFTGVAPLSAAKGNKDVILTMRMEKGSYELAVEPIREREDLIISQRINHLLKGTLTDQTLDRWQTNELTLWLRKETLNIPTSKLHKQAATGILFDNKEYFSPKYLAYDVHRKWETARRTLKVSDIARWSNLALKNQILTEFLESIEPSNKASPGMLTDQKIARIIMALDPTGPIRHQHISAHISGLGSAVAYSHATARRETTQSIGTVFHDGLVETWVRIQPNPDYYSTSLLGWNAHRVKQYIRNAALGFGMERCLYELNHTLPCQSPLIEHFYTGNLMDLMYALNTLAQNAKDDRDPLDRHIAAYLAGKINITEEIQIKTLQNFPYLGRNPQVLMTAVLAVAQGESKIKSLPDLATWIENRLSGLVDGLHSRSIRRELRDELRKAAKQGSVPALFKVISSAAIPRRDLLGYREAKRQYQHLRDNILSLKNEDSIERLAYHLGLRICTTVSYAVLTISIFYSLFQTM